MVGGVCCVIVWGVCCVGVGVCEVFGCVCGWCDVGGV